MQQTTSANLDESEVGIFIFVTPASTFVYPSGGGFAIVTIC